MSGDTLTLIDAKGNIIFIRQVDLPGEQRWVANANGRALRLHLIRKPG